jgi:glyoxylase-like metal-dependent hydrolase (beta-lactamase superfamily II)
MEIVDGVHRFGTGMVNWYLIERDGRLTLVDAGMRGYWRQLERALRDLGRKLDEVEAVVLTHAHADHIGFAHQVKANSDATLWVHERDAEPGVRRFPPFHLYLRPTAWPLLVHGLRNGLLATPDADAAEVRTFTDGEVLDVPGQPRIRHLPGHTRGNCALHLADASVVFSGDALVTFDPYRRRRGPRLLIKGVNEDNAQARASLDQLAELNAQVLLPGHGEPWRDGVAAAVAEAQARGYW